MPDTNISLIGTSTAKSSQRAVDTTSIHSGKMGLIAVDAYPPRRVSSKSKDSSKEEWEHRLWCAVYVQDHSSETLTQMYNALQSVQKLWPALVTYHSKHHGATRSTEQVREEMEEAMLVALKRLKGRVMTADGTPATCPAEDLIRIDQARIIRSLRDEQRGRYVRLTDMTRCASRVSQSAEGDGSDLMCLSVEFDIDAQHRTEEDKKEWRYYRQQLQDSRWVRIGKTSNAQSLMSSFKAGCLSLDRSRDRVVEVGSQTEPCLIEDVIDTDEMSSVEGQP